MRATWRLATNNLAGRPLRTALLAGSIVAAVMFMIAVASMLQTIDRSHEKVIGRLFGLAQLRVVHRFNQRVEADLTTLLAARPEVTAASPVFEQSMALRHAGNDKRLTLQALGIEPAAYETMRPSQFVQGRMIDGPGQIVLDEGAAKQVEAALGDELQVIHFGPDTRFTLVGIIQRPELGVVQRPLGLVMLAAAQTLAGLPGRVDYIELQLRNSQDADVFAAAVQPSLPGTARLQTTASATAGLSQAMDAAKMMLALVSCLVFIAAGFIIAASLTTAVTERLRELAILRSIGATRFQVAAAQLLSGAMLTTAGTLIGLPLGLAGSYWLYSHYQAMLPGGFDPAWSALAVAVGAALLAGIAAAAYPAMLAARMSPVTGMAARSWKPSRWGIVVCLLLGLTLILGPMTVLLFEINNQALFWFFTYAGIPMVLAGYFIFSVPAGLAVNALLARPVGVILRLPARLLGQAGISTPYRSGFTAGAMMVSLAMLVNIWMGGRSMLQGWFDRIQIPDAFIHSPTPIPEEQLQKLQDLPYVIDTTRITAFPVPTQGAQFGVHRFSPRQTLYVACDIESFIRIADLKWIQGDRDSVLQEMAKGQAVIVSQEFLSVHGLGKGDTLSLQTQLGPKDFRIAGVAVSPGADVAVQFYGIGRNYAHASIGSIVGTNQDALTFWDVSAANLILVSLDDYVSDKVVLAGISEVLPGVMRSSARQIRDRMHMAAGRLMGIASTVAMLCLAIACLGVGNLILASIHARQFELGVLRAMGSTKPVLARLIAGQTLIIAIAGCVLGVAMGTQATIIGQHLYRALLGIEYDLIIPWDVIAWGSVAVIAAAIVSAIPAIVQVWRAHPRTLLAME